MTLLARLASILARSLTEMPLPLGFPFVVPTPWPEDVPPRCAFRAQTSSRVAASQANPR